MFIDFLKKTTMGPMYNKFHGAHKCGAHYKSMGQQWGPRVGPISLGPVGPMVGAHFWDYMPQNCSKSG